MCVCEFGLVLGRCCLEQGVIYACVCVCVCVLVDKGSRVEVMAWGDPEAELVGRSVLSLPLLLSPSTVHG